MQFFAATQFDQGESLYVHLRERQSGFEVRLAGTVQWQRSAEGYAFTIGYQFQEEVDWATRLMVETMESTCNWLASISS